MSGNPVAGSPAATAGAADPSAGQQSYGFTARVLLMAALLLVTLTVVFTLIRVLLYLFVVRSAGRRRHSGLAVGILRLRSINSFGSHGRGLDGSALSALPITAYRKGSGSTGGAGADCAVCLSELADGDKVRELPNCGHVFHVECVDAWLRARTTCPLCRAEVELPDGYGKADAVSQSQPSSSASQPPQPALVDSGRTLIVTVHGVSDTRRSVPATGSAGQ
jgi:E3 ubiquitin-protein ligase ATL41